MSRFLVPALDSGAPPTPSAPVNVVLPSILHDGTPQVGEVLTANPGSWTGYPPPSFTYQWQNNGVDIVGETDPTYTPIASDEGDTITVEVTADNGVGPPVMAESAGVVIQPSGGGDNVIGTAVIGTAVIG